MKTKREDPRGQEGPPCRHEKRAGMIGFRRCGKPTKLVLVLGESRRSRTDVYECEDGHRRRLTMRRQPT